MVEERARSPNWLPWFIAAALWHLLLWIIHPDWHPTLLPPRVEIQQVDPSKLAAIKKQWQAQQRTQDKDTALLLNKDKSAPTESEKPKDARYMSDRNKIVEHEQRARDMDVIPKPGRPGPEAPDKTEPKPRTVPKPPTVRAQPHALPKLGNLGVPMRLNEAARTPRDAETQENKAQKHFEDVARHQAGQSGGDQAIVDKNLPLGSENMLSTEESIYYSFYSRLYEAIAPIWQSEIRQVPWHRNVTSGNYVTTADVILDADGNLVGIDLTHNSGIPDFDQAVNTAWHKIGRFPNPPKALLDPHGQVHTGWTFTVDVGENSGFQYMPPERSY